MGAVGVDGEGRGLEGVGGDQKCLQGHLPPTLSACEPPSSKNSDGLEGIGGCRVLLILFMMMMMISMMMSI